MKRSWLVIVLLLSLGVNIGILATLGIARARGEGEMRARFERWERGRGDRPPIERLAERLGLEGEARDQFILQHRQFYETVERIRQSQFEVRHELRREVGSPNPDRERIDELLAQSARLTAALDRAFVENVLACRELLDERQERAYFGLLSRLREMNEGRRDPPGRRPRPDPGRGPPI